MINFKSYTYTQFRLPIKCFQANNGIEFVNNATRSFLAALVILLHLSYPHIRMARMNMFSAH